MTRPRQPINVHTVRQAFAGIAPDLAAACRSCGEPSEVAVGDLAEALMFQLDAELKDFPAIRDIVRKHLSHDGQAVYL